MGFAYPLGLLALASLAVLVWIYLREQRQKRLDVPSLMLWTDLRDDVRARRFPIDPLFLLQALLLLVLALAVARPYLERVDETATLRRAVFLFDTSASMQTLEEGHRRFDRARERARALLGELARSTEVMVVAVEMRPRVVLPFTRDHVRAGRAIDEIDVGDGPSRLALGIQFARRLRGVVSGPLELYVFTDLPRTELAAPLAAGERLHYVRVGVSDDNVALAALRVYQNPFQEAAEAEAFALVRNYSSRRKTAGLIVELAGEPVLERTLDLGPREARAVPIRGLEASGRLEARLDVADALAVDDRALAWVQAAGSVRLLLVGGHGALASDLKRLAEIVPVFRLDTAPAQTRSEDDPVFARADVVVFQDAMPARPLPTNALFVHPPPGNELFPVEGEVQGAQILDWDERHPLLRDLRYVDALDFDHVRRLRTPDWARAVIVSRAGGHEIPLALAGEVDGRRVVAFAFDLSGHSVRESGNLSLLLLLLNTLRWLTPPDADQPLQVDIGDSYRETLLEPASVLVDPPSGPGTRLSARGEVAVDIDRRGEYRIRVGDTHRTVFANLFDPRESDVGRDGEPIEELVERGTAVVSIGRARWVRDLAPWLYLAALGLLVVEWLAGVGRRRAHAD